MRNTLILPTDDSQLAASLLQGAINDLNVVLMLVIGREDPAHQAVVWADQLADKTRIGTGFNSRHVVWIRKPSVKAVSQILDGILQRERPLVAVLNFHDDLATTLTASQPIDPIALEQAFLIGEGGQ